MQYVQKQIVTNSSAITENDSREKEVWKKKIRHQAAVEEKEKERRKYLKVSVLR